MDKEICICAAVVASNGYIIRCHRHIDGYEGLRSRGLMPGPVNRSEGFMTSKNRFVSRGEGFFLQKAAGIKSANSLGYIKKGELHSEDLY